MVDNLSPPGSITPEQEEELRAYGRAMGQINLGQTEDMMGAGSPWRVLLGALRGVQSRSALEAVESSRAGRRTRQARLVPGVVSLSPGTISPPGAQTGAQAPPSGNITVGDAGAGIHPSYVRVLTGIEASDNPNALSPTGRYRGLGMFSPDLEQRYGITDWTNRAQQESAILRHAQYHSGLFKQRMGRDPNPGELYLMHQQGAGGAIALLSSPGETAFDVLMRLPYYQRMSNPAYAVRTAIENNLPRNLKGRWRQMTAGEFANQWISRFNSRIGPAQVGATSAPTTSPTTPPTSGITTAPVGGGQKGTASNPYTFLELGMLPESERPPGTHFVDENGLWQTGSGGQGSQFVASVPNSLPTTIPQATASIVQTGGGEGSPLPFSVSAPPPPGTGQELPVSDVGSPGYFAEGNIPPNVPRQIQVNPALLAILQRFRDPNAMSQQDFNKALEEYQKLSVPREIQTTYGTAIYNPLTGQLQDFIPSGIIRRPVSAGGVQTDQLLAPDATAGGFTIAPIAPTPGLDGPGARATSTASGLPPSLQPELRDFPEGGNIGEIATWGMQANSIRSMMDKMAESHAGQVSTAQQAGQRASRRISELNVISALTDASRASRWTGQPFSDWQTRIAQFLINFDPRHRNERTDFLNHLGYREILSKLNAFLASEATQDISARGTNFEFRTLLDNNPNLVSSYEGTQMLLSYMRQEQEHMANLARMASRLSPSQYGRWSSIVENYYQQNPIMIEVPPTTNARGVTTPGMRITTARIPLPGEVKPDGNGTWTTEEIRAYIQSLPQDVWFINPRTRNLVPSHPPVATTTAPPIRATARATAPPFTPIPRRMGR